MPNKTITVLLLVLALTLIAFAWFLGVQHGLDLAKDQRSEVTRKFFSGTVKNSTDPGYIPGH